MTQIDARQKILEANANAARALREQFEADGTLVLNLISSPGSGKTTLLEETARRLASRWRLGAIVGDVATERDAERLRDAGLPAYQIVTGGACHLDARMVVDALSKADLGHLDILFVENVGNLVCPTSYDLGEHTKVALLSVAEGVDKPFKYPGIFSKAGITVITKLDLCPHVRFDIDVACEQIRTLNPDATIVQVSAETGLGMAEWCDLLQRRVLACRTPLASL